MDNLTPPSSAALFNGAMTTPEPTTAADVRRQNLRQLAERLGSVNDLAAAISKSASQISQWLNASPDSRTGKPRHISDGSARQIEQALNLKRGWMDSPAPPPTLGGAYLGKDANPARYRIEEGTSDNGASPVQFLDARGSCGGGVANIDAELRTPLLKEPGWFRRYRVRPDDAIAVWADGDSMADFIVDGDICIFNRVRRMPQSGKIFLIQHPDGLRIKRLRREIDGTWVLESNNPDKRRYPDERVGPDQADMLVILGEFLYRQGG